MSATIKVEKLKIPGAEVGKPNPLPDIKNNTYIHATIDIADSIAPDELPNLKKGMIPTLLPYMTQDGYDRSRDMLEMDIVVLENEYLRAEFMPGMGARLRRLYDKVTGKELLYVNPVFAPCNLALRNAWFSGGVEFNVGIKGHNPLTCSPVFAEKRTDSDGREYVSFYEYERIRGLVWSVSAYLPSGAKTLMIKCRIENTSNDKKFMYWWSNIAVEETEGMRVIAPTDKTYVNYFGNDSYVLDKSPMPDASALNLSHDISYPGNLRRSIDFFYNIPDERKKWIVSVDKDGSGLLQFSDNTLIGRKLFLWGQGSGGKHWGEYLSVPGSTYVEIQAGLAKTQLEHFTIEGNEVIEFVEYYGPINIDKEVAHGEWNAAQTAVENEISLFTEQTAEFPELDAVNTKMLARGSAWGGLEEKIGARCGSKYFKDWGYDKTENPEGAYFEELIEDGVLAEPDILEEPLAYVTGEKWEMLLRRSLENPEAQHYATYLHLGVNLYAKFCYGDMTAGDECVEMWKKSLEAKKNPWALRNLAAFYANEKKDYKTALPYILEAIDMHNANRALAVDCASILLAAGEREKWLEVSEILDESIKYHGRVQLLRAKALIELERFVEADKILCPGFELADIKEGEVSISEMWFMIKAGLNNISLDEAKEQFELPYEFDFRTH